jgi:hypothetical protein
MYIYIFLDSKHIAEVSLERSVVRNKGHLCTRLLTVVNPHGITWVRSPSHTVCKPLTARASAKQSGQRMITPGWVRFLNRKTRQEATCSQWRHAGSIVPSLTLQKMFFFSQDLLCHLKETWHNKDLWVSECLSWQRCLYITCAWWLVGSHHVVHSLLWGHLGHKLQTRRPCSHSLLTEVLHSRNTKNKHPSEKVSSSHKCSQKRKSEWSVNTQNYARLVKIWGTYENNSHANYSNPPSWPKWKSQTRSLKCLSANPVGLRQYCESGTYSITQQFCF